MSSAKLQIPFNRPVLLQEHPAILQESFSTWHLSGNGPFTKKCETNLQTRLSKSVRIVSSGTHALEMMGLLADLAPGDEVIVPSYTFVSTANAFALRGAKLLFADNDAWGNILPSEIERLRTKKTKAVVAVHYAGASADMDQLIELCAQHGLLLFEDAAQAIGASYRGRALGTLGALGCFSFHETKNVTSGEGGALILGQEDFLDRAEILREKGTDRSRFFKGFVDKYTWVGLGSSYVLSDLNAAYLYPQLLRLEEINARRRQICDAYHDGLRGYFAKREIRILETPKHNTPNYHMFAAIFPTAGMRADFIAYMKSHGITCPFHYVPLHTSPFGAGFSHGKPELLPGCEKLASCLVRFPLYYNMSDEELSYTIEKARQWANQV